VFRGLPADFSLPIVFVLHIGRPFAAALAEWFDGQCPFRVRQAEDGEPVPPPDACRIVMAPADRHLTIRDGRFRLVDGPERHSCRPSVDTLFESVANEFGAAAIACLLTGMGRDGAEGLLAVRRAGGRTIAQDESTSIVFGMPREAVLLGAVERILPLQEVAPAILTLARGRLESRSS
jgi:two-component system chemotaxis response regulator CheB